MKKLMPWVVLLLFAAYVGASFAKTPQTGAFDLAACGEIPVLHRGRIKPLDTVARSSLLAIYGKQALRGKEGTPQAVEWLLEVATRTDRADQRKIFRIDHSEVLGMMHITQEKEKYFAFSDLLPHMAELQTKAMQAHQIKDETRSSFEQALVKLDNALRLYQSLKNTLQPQGARDFPAELETFSSVLSGLAENGATGGEEQGNRLRAEANSFMQRYAQLAEAAVFAPFPPLRPGLPASEWLTAGDVLLMRSIEPEFHPLLLPYVSMLRAYQTDDAAAFNRHVGEVRAFLDKHSPGLGRKAEHEALFNRVQPFYKASVIYVFVFLFAFVSWLAWPEMLNRTAFYCLLLAFLIHTVALGARMYLENRPPVTNLYSSAVFVGWVAVLLGAVLERIYRIGIGSMVAAAIGFASLIIAHHLSLQGDTMEMMRAVLDSNFWLATHVVTITIGYGSTFLAGFLALVYVLRGLFTSSLGAETAKSIARMIYGIVCFSLLFSFVGTVLGGIWADQSWGRFWGWDPKENGALLIVLWNAIILHARWAGLIKERGLVCMALFGNIITSWSWFGVNMLGIGLHSYGFMDKAFQYLLAFWVFNLLWIGAALLPLRYWRSFSKIDLRSDAISKSTRT